ncbi:hypothetical protein ASE67_06300 [Sphingomonas sp. Leaf23]|uniref:hypothetical protein n=1 Tax=Sphingomonas sp. Leaf23 TaxID=1735689 RepID=UPI0006F64AF1|nr:hypothetical protein [Sphingomonas sp. Leaf23]KQM87325.1 hypothetical protein ASE67_06300 [Sphingomonas sp. Leaf23]
MIGDAVELLRGTAVELRRDPVAAVVGLVPLIALGMWGDLGGAGIMPLSFFAASIASFVLHYVLTRRAMRAGGLLAKDASGDVSGLFLLNLVSNLATALGFVLLILPGIWLLARWLAAVPILFAEKTTPSEAMAASAARTRPLLVPIILAVVALYAPSIAALVASIALPEADIISPGMSFVINFASTISQLAGWYMAIATYRAVQPEPVEAVFA